MLFDIDTLKTFFEKENRAIDWIVEEVIRQKNWLSLSTTMASGAGESQGAGAHPCSLFAS
jgi:hypothetical protein